MGCICAVSIERCLTAIFWQTSLAFNPRANLIRGSICSVRESRLREGHVSLISWLTVYGQDIMVMMRYEYDAVLHELPEKGGAYVAFPWDLKKRERDG